jgi:hypothetical protein
MIFYPHLKMTDENTSSSSNKKTSGKITLALLNFLFKSNDPHPFLNRLLSRFYENPESSDDYFSFTKSKNISKKINELKKRFESQNYTLSSLKALITENLEYAKEEDRDYMINNLDYEISKIENPDRKILIKPVPKSLKLNKTLLKYAFPKKEMILLDNVISKIHIEEPLVDYKQKINALHGYIKSTNSNPSDLSEFISSINNDIEAGKIEINIKRERTKARKKERDLAEVTRDVSSQYKREKEDLEGKPVRHRKTKEKRAKRLVKKFKIIRDDNDEEEWRTTAEQRDSLINEIDEILNMDISSLNTIPEKKRRLE